MFQVSDHRKKLALKNMMENICFVGHTHMLEMISYNGLSCDTSSLPEGITRLEKGEKYPVKYLEGKKIVKEIEQFGVTKIPELLIKTGKERIRAYSGNLSKEEIMDLWKIL